MSYELTQVATDWDSLSDAEKEALFENYEQPTSAEMLSLGKFKIIVQSNNASKVKTNVSINALPNPTVFLPNTLFWQTFKSINSITIDDSITKYVAYPIYYFFTKDLETYYTYKNSTWTQLADITTATITSSGMTATEVAALTSSNLAEFFEEGTGIGIGFMISSDDIFTVPYIDNLAMTVNIEGYWKKALHGTDYDYAYINSTTLQFQILSDGTYKINYSMGELTE